MNSSEAALRAELRPSAHRTVRSCARPTEKAPPASAWVPGPVACLRKRVPLFQRGKRVFPSAEPKEAKSINTRPGTRNKAVDQGKEPSQDRPKKDLFVEAASLCRRLAKNSQAHG